MTIRANGAAASVLELLSSMRFAVSLLIVVAIASTIGTILKQGEPYANYLEQFGPFWFPAFERLGLYSVYSAWWFLLILAFWGSICSFRAFIPMVNSRLSPAYLE